jgi:hypothetical protein
MKEIQRLIMSQNNIRDTTNVTIENPDGGLFYLYIQNPRDNKMWQSDKLYTNTSAYNFN